MPAAEDSLPEGTDTIIAGAGVDAGDAAPATGDSASPRQDRAGATMRDTLFKNFDALRGQAGDHARDFAQTGKDHATATLDNVIGLIEDAASEIDARLGSQYGDYARRAAQGLGGFTDDVKGKDVDTLFDDARNLVKSSPAIAIGAAAVLGFVVARLARAGMPDASGPREDAPTA